jgi:type II secretory pathway pseudopilin PulG
MRGLIVWATIEVVLLAAVYAAGHAQGRARARSAEAAASDAQTQLAGARASLQIVQARALVYRGAVELERRNFGTANDDLKQAVHQLQTAQLAPSDSRSAAVKALATDLDKLDVRVAQNVDAQRTAVLDMAGKLDALP